MPSQITGKRKSPAARDTADGRAARGLSDVTITIDSEPLDEHGYLVHAEDPTAQLCLALVGLEAALRAGGKDLSAVTRLRVLTVDPTLASELVDVVAERFDDTTATTISCVEVERLAVDGMLVALSAEVAVAPRPSGVARSTRSTH